MTPSEQAAHPNLRGAFPRSPGALSQVCIFHQALVRGGGMEHYAILLARAFKELGCEVTFYARKVDAQLASELNLKVRQSSSAWVPRKLRDWQFHRQVRRSAPEMPGRHIALSRVPVRDLIICGGTHKGFLKAAGRLRGPLDRLQERLEANGYSAARQVISHSDLCTAELRELYSIAGEKISTVYPPLDTKFTPGDRDASSNTFDFPKDKLVLLFPSMGHKRKGLPALCEALKPLADQIIIAVAGKPADSSRYPFLHPLGYVRDMEVAYRAADFTLLGSWYEPFGLVGPESVLCGTRLIFEERIGCLPALSPEVVLRFRISDANSIRAAVQEALRLKKLGKHRVAAPESALRYDPSPIAHARRLIEIS